MSWRAIDSHSDQRTAINDVENFLVDEYVNLVVKRTRTSAKFEPIRSCIILQRHEDFEVLLCSTQRHLRATNKKAQSAIMNAIIHHCTADSEMDGPRL